MKNFRGSLLTISAVLLLLSTISCSPAVTTPGAATEPTATSLPAPSPAPTIQPGDSKRELDVDGSKRTYYLHIPPGVDLDHPVPLVLVFHGYTYPVAQTRSHTQFDEMADENSFITVYPVGIGTSWNAGDCCGIAVEEQVDDAAFVRQIVSDLGTVANVDPKRIYASGFSNGAMLAYRLGCKMSDTFAAIAPMAGMLVFSPCQPQQPVSILHMHGSNDPYAPYAGGAPSPDCGSGCSATLPPVEQGIETWALFNGCTGSPEEKVDGAITHRIYPCPSGTAIELYTLDGMEHAWPQSGGSGELNFPATQTIWDFFAAHSKP